MNELWHILDRASIHFTAATSLVLMAATAYRALYRRTRSQWFPKSMIQTLVYSGLTVFAISTLREAWDVGHGQSILKAFTDYASWLLGAGFGVFGLYRFRYYSWED